jgi:hypothetical protein
MVLGIKPRVFNRLSKYSISPATPGAPFISILRLIFSLGGPEILAYIIFLLYEVSFNISYKAGLLLEYSFKFCLSEKLFLLLLHNNFAEYRSLGW